MNPTQSYDELTAVIFSQNVPDGELNASLTTALRMPLEYIDGTRTHVASGSLGKFSVGFRDGQASLDTQRRTLATPTVMIGGVPARVQFSGPAPQFPGGRAPIPIRLGDITSTDRITIAVRN